VPPQAGSAWYYGGVSILGMLSKLFVSKDACLFEFIHVPFLISDVHPTMGCSKCMILHCCIILWDEAQWEAHVFVASHGSVY
jgi:hypothetical protein